MAENGLQIDVEISETIEKHTEVDKLLTLKEDDLNRAASSDLSLTNLKGSNNDLSQIQERKNSDFIVRQISEVFVEQKLEGTFLSDIMESSFVENESLMLNTTTFSNENVTYGANLINHTDNMTYVVSEWSDVQIGAVIVASLMVPFILLSNLFVIVSVLRFRRLHTPTNYFITSLAAVDILVALATPFVIIIEVSTDSWGKTSALMCLLPNRVLMTTCGVSLLTLAAIAYDRHKALTCPYRYVNIMTVKKVVIMITTTWVYSSVIVWLPLVLGWYDDKPDVTGTFSAKHLYSEANTLFLIAIFLPSVGVILFCYFRIFIVARYHAKQIAAFEFAVHRNLQLKFMIKDTKYAKTLGIVIGVFLALWLPYLICMFIETINTVSCSVWVHTYLTLLAVLNSGINPFIYAFKNKEFKAAFRRLCKESVRNRLCPLEDRRKSLVSCVSNSPRLSRTNSRLVSTFTDSDSTLDSTCEKLKRSLDSLDELEHYYPHPIVCTTRSHSVIFEEAEESTSDSITKQDNSEVNKYSNSESNINIISKRLESVLPSRYQIIPGNLNKQENTDVVEISLDKQSDKNNQDRMFTHSNSLPILEFLSEMNVNCQTRVVTRDHSDGELSIPGCLVSSDELKSELTDCLPSYCAPHTILRSESHIVNVPSLRQSSPRLYRSFLPSLALREHSLSSTGSTKSPLSLNTTTKLLSSSPSSPTSAPSSPTSAPSSPSSSESSLQSSNDCSSPSLSTDSSTTFSPLFKKSSFRYSSQTKHSLSEISESKTNPQEKVTLPNQVEDSDTSVTLETNTYNNYFCDNGCYDSTATFHPYFQNTPSYCNDSIGSIDVNEEQDGFPLTHSCPSFTPVIYLQNSY